MARYAHLACLVAALFGILGPAGSVRATNKQASSECAWRHLRGELRTALVTAYLQHGSDGLGRVQIADPMMEAVARACLAMTGEPAQLKAVSTAIAGAAMRHGAERGLAARGARVTELDKIWRTSSDGRNVLLAAIRNPDHSSEAARQLFGAVAGLVQLAGGPVPADQNPMSDPLFHTYADYFIGRALEEESEFEMQH